MTTTSRPLRSQPSPRQAALFVDYANLHALLAERLEEPEQAASHIAEALAELRRYLADEDGTETILTAAYADFSALDASGDEDLQSALYRQGVEPRFVPASPQEHTVEVQLSIDATALLHRRPDVQTFALVTGDRPFLPLVQALRRQGAHAFVAALDPPPLDAFSHSEGGAFMDLLNLLSDAARRDLLQSGEMPPRREDERASHQSARPSYERLDDEMLVRTLEIAEEHFGQYDEVYLTPLLRKLSDVLEERFDPKALVSDLEEAGAVRLEKRRGYPYDYTVLIVERDHPDVEEMEEAFYGRQRSAYERGGASGDPSSSSYDPSDDGYDDYEPDGYESDGFDDAPVEADYENAEYENPDYDEDDERY